MSLCHLNSNPIIIVGAGWAGLTAAVSLARAGRKVLILESAPHAGGRARGIKFGNDTVDNGQHLLIGAYQQTLSLLKWLNIPEEKVFHRSPFELLMTKNLGTSELADLHLRLPNLPAPFHLFMGIMNAKGLSIKERLSVIGFFRNVQKHNFELPEDTSVLKLLNNFNQPVSIIQRLWGPIALAALSTPIEQASASVFLQILKQIFINKKKYSDWLFSKVDLSQVLPSPLIQYLNTSGGVILYHQRAEALIVNQGQITGIRTTQQTFEAQSVILATPPHITAQLLSSYITTEQNYRTLISNLQKFDYQPITTVYFRYAKPISLSAPMIGLLNNMGHWIFDRKTVTQANILSVVMSGKGIHSTMDHPSIVERVCHELKKLNHLSSTLALEPIESRVITEKRAAFSCEVGIESYRTSYATPIPNLWIAGDYTQFGYPSTLEAAVSSGKEVAKGILYKEHW